MTPLLRRTIYHTSSFPTWRGSEDGRTTFVSQRTPVMIPPATSDRRLGRCTLSSKN